MTDIYIVGQCACGGRIIAPVLASKHFRPQPPVCERSGKVSLECTDLPPEPDVAVVPTVKRFLMETR